MVYVEWLRIRRRFMWFGAVVIVLLAINLLPIVFGHVTTTGKGDYTLGFGNGGAGTEGIGQLATHFHIPISALLGIAAMLALIFTTSLGASLNAQSEALNLAFTKPLSRERLALTIFGVDLGAIVAWYAFCFVVVCLGPLAVLHLLGRVESDPYVVPVALAGIGVCLMYYGMLQGATAWLRGGAGLVLGLSWPLFLLAAIPGSPPFGAVFNALLDGVRFLDPIVYLRNAIYFASSSDPTLGSAFGPLLLTVSALGIAGCACAVVEWRRLEV